MTKHVTALGRETPMRADGAIRDFIADIVMPLLHPCQPGGFIPIIEPPLCSLSRRLQDFLMMKGT